VALSVARTAWSAATAGSGALAAGAVVLLALSWDAPVPDAWGFRGYAILQAAAFTAVGAFIAIRRSGNAIGWLLLAAGALNAVEAFAIHYAEFTIRRWSPRVALRRGRRLDRFVDLGPGGEPDPARGAPALS